MFALTFSLPAANAQQESQLDVAFLEYLAELENVDGRWVGALDLLKSEGNNDASGGLSLTSEGDIVSPFQREANNQSTPAQESSPKELTDKGVQR